MGTEQQGSAAHGQLGCELGGQRGIEVEFAGARSRNSRKKRRQDRRICRKGGVHCIDMHTSSSYTPRRARAARFSALWSWPKSCRLFDHRTDFWPTPATAPPTPLARTQQPWRTIRESSSTFTSHASVSAAFYRAKWCRYCYTDHWLPNAHRRRYQPSHYRQGPRFRPDQRRRGRRERPHDQRQERLVRLLWLREANGRVRRQLEHARNQRWS